MSAHAWWGGVAVLTTIAGCKASVTPDVGAPVVGVPAPPADPPLNGDPKARVGPFLVDLDQDGLVDSLTLLPFPDSEMPPVFGAVAFHLSANSIDTVIRGYWDAPGYAQFQGGDNLIANSAMFVARGTGDRTFVFLFGQDGVDPGQGLEIYSVSRRGVRKYYSPGPFDFDGPLVREQGRVVGFRGRAGSSEGMIMAHGDTLGGGSYVPTLVFRLGDTITIDSAATQAATRKALGGFAGYTPTADIAVNMKDGSRFVISSGDHRRLP